VASQAQKQPSTDKVALSVVKAVAGGKIMAKSPIILTFPLDTAILGLL
jgi:hypothetical protein